jgi:hypothetical protein
MKTIPLSRGMVALVDDDGFESISLLHWYAHGNSQKGFYAVCHVNVKHRRITIPMHRCVLMLPYCRQTDHKNGNSLDNRKGNIRPSTHSQNQANSKKPKHGKTSVYKGVRWHFGTSKWCAGIRFSGRSIHLGLFTREIDAAKAYNDAAGKLFGEFARPCQKICSLQTVSNLQAAANEEVIKKTKNQETHQ